MRATLMLCDYAQVENGRLYISGGGWSVTGPGPIASAIAAKFDVPWDQTNRKITLALRLLDQDGQQVTQPGPLGEQPVQIEGEFEVGRPAGVLAGTPIDAAIAVNLPVMQLIPGRRYSWELSLDGETRDEWHLAFTTKPLPPGVQFVPQDPPSTSD